MKVCFIGLGSIGKRHLRNLVKISEECHMDLEIHTLRKTNKPLDLDIQNLIEKQIFDEKYLEDDYDVTFITNPTFMHFNTIKLMEDKTRHMFIEKPVFDDINYDLDDLKLRKDGIYYVAGPLKFTRVIQDLKQILSEEKVYSVRSICSSYLPEWRPDQDYRKIYSANKSDGGGVSLDLIHEWDYITYLFNLPQEVFNLNGKYSHLEIDSDDLSIYIAKYEDKLVEVHLDYFGRIPRRTVEILTQNGLIVGDFVNKRINFTDGRKTLDFSKEDNDMYVEEMKSFIEKILKATRGQNDIECAYKTLRLAKGNQI